MLQEQASQKQQCLEMLGTMDSQVKEQVLDAVRSNSKYIDFEKLAKHLSKNSGEIRLEDFIDNDRLVKDVSDGKALSSFLSEFGDARLDVVSLAELSKVVKHKSVGEAGAQMEAVLNHLDEQLKQVSHTRRSQLTLGEYLSEHSGLNSSSLREYSRSLHEAQKQAATEAIITGTVAHPAGPLGTEADIDQSLVAAALGSQEQHRNPQYFDAEGVHSNDASEANKLQEMVYAEAMKAAEFSPDMQHLRNQFENELLKEYTQPRLHQTRIEQLIGDYMNIRLKECMVRPAFAKGLKSAHASVYMRILRENIIDELKLAESPKKDEFTFDKSVFGSFEKNMHYELESMYNLNELNNEQAIGYHNLEARAADVANNRDLAHESVFDKMMADYFLDKRGEYKKGNKLLKDLEEVFKVQYADPELRQGQTLGE